MKLIIKTPQELQEHEVAWVELNTATGNLVIQPGHAPSIMLLTPFKSLIFRLMNGKQETITIVSGIVEISRTQVLALLTVQ
jgi:F0F1-type ATP synthase epsilon subunit